MPMRTTAIHIVNQSWAFDACFQMFKPFLNERMKQQIFVHGSDMTSLHKHIKPEHLPVRYGGPHAEYPYTAWMNNMIYDENLVKEIRGMGFMITEEELEEARKRLEEI